MTRTEAIGQDLRQLFDGGCVAGLTDTELLERLARRDGMAEAAFDAILTRHGAVVLAYCRRVLGDADMAEDAFQAVFLVLLRRAGTIQGDGSLRPWLLGVAHRVALKVREGEIHRRAREHRAARPERFEPEVVASDVRVLVRAEVERLPVKYREAVDLCYFKGHTHDDAAEALGWPVGTVRGRLSRARAMLRSRLSRRGIGVTSTAVASALAGGTGARAEISKALREATRAAAARDAVVGATVASLAAGVARGLAVTGVLKAGLIALAVVSVLSAVSGVVARAGGDGGAPPIARDQPGAEVQVSALERTPAVDLFCDPLPKGATARLGTLRFRHGGATIWSVLFSPDGKSLVTVGGEDNEARVWDVASGRLRWTVDAYKVALTRDGKTLFTAKSGLRQAIDFATGRVLRKLEADPKEILNLFAASPDGTTLATVVTRYKPLTKPRSALVFYNAGTLAERFRVEGDYQHSRTLAFAPDGRSLVLAGPDVPSSVEGNFLGDVAAASTRVFDVATGAEVWQFPIEGFSIGSVAFAPDGETLAVGVADRTIRLYDLVQGRERLPRLGGERAVPQPEKGKAASWSDGARAAYCLTFSPDGSMLASGMEPTIGNFPLVDVPPITLWDIAGAREIRRFPGHLAMTASLAFAPNGKTLASVGWEPMARLWDVTTGLEVSPRPAHRGEIRALAVSPADGTVFAASLIDGLVRHWDPATGRQLGVIASLPAAIHGLTVSPDGKTLFLASDAGGILWDVQRQREIRRFTTTGKFDRFFQGTFSPDGRTVTSGLRVWDVVTGRLLANFRNKGEEAWQSNGNDVTATYTADSRRLITVEPNGVRLWDIATGNEVGRPIQAELPNSYNVALSPDGRFLATGNLGENRIRTPELDPLIRIWELASGRQVATVTKHPEQVFSLAFSPDGRTLASTSGYGQSKGDRGVRVWDVATGRLLRRFDSQPVGASRVAYRPDGRSIVSMSEDGLGLVWDVSDLADRRIPPPRDTSALEALWADLASDDAPRAHRASWALSVAEAVPFLRDRLAIVGPPAGRELLRLLRAIAALERAGSPQAREALKDLAQDDRDARITLEASMALNRLSRKPQGK